MDKPKTMPEKATRTTVDTIAFTPTEAKAWIIPPFQRPLSVNEKVRMLAEQVSNDGGVIPGILTFGVLNKQIFLIDGQHRREAFLIAGKPEGFADARTCYFDSMAEMGEEFVKLNSQLVRMKPDDMLRGLEASMPLIAKIRTKCPFIGYDCIRYKGGSAILSMSIVLRSWYISSKEVPTSTISSLQVAKELLETEADNLISFLTLAVNAWGRDPEYFRLWGALNMTMCMWIFRRIVLSRHSPKTMALTKEMFQKCLTALSAETVYLDWLVGRKLSDRDRSPCYQRIKSIIQRRIKTETGSMYLMPAPPWTLGKKS